MGAPKNNRYAAKERTASTWLQVRCIPEDKARWELSARDAKLTLSQWVIKTLNRIVD